MSRNSLLLAASLLALTFIKTHKTSAQVGADDLFRRADALILAQPFVLAGRDVGFRVIRMDGQIPVGQIVVRIDGAWVAAETAKQLSGPSATQTETLLTDANVGQLGLGVTVH